VIIETIKPGSDPASDAPPNAGRTDQPGQGLAQDRPGPRKGLRLTVYRAAGRPDCTLGGITSAAGTVTVTTIRETGAGRDTADRPVPGDCQVCASEPGAPEAVLVIRHRPGGARWVHLQPAAKHYMHGGNYAGTSDSRWEPLSGTDLVAVHDRHEG
jgi:hypothetical protein